MNKCRLPVEIIKSCINCTLREECLFADLSLPNTRDLRSLKHSTAYPKGALLFVEGQTAHGVFILCKGRIKISVSSSDGKVLIVEIAEPGDILGLSATVSGKPYELTAQTLGPCQLDFVSRDDFLRYLAKHSEVSFRVVEQLGEKYNAVCREMRTLLLVRSPAEKLAKLLLEFSNRNGDGKQSLRINLAFNQQQIGEMIGTSRETVSRLFGDFTRREFIRLHGSTVTICNRRALESLVSSSLTSGAHSLAPTH